MNILILSVGTRNKVIQYFKKTFAGDGTIVATDMSNISPAVYEADKFYQVPRMTVDGYIDVIFDICMKEKIDAVLSLIDPELSLLADHVGDFSQLGVTIIGSSYDLCERCLDKYEMYKWFTEHGYRCAKSFVDKNEFYKTVEEGDLTYPVVVKPIKGSASIAITKAIDQDTVDFLFRHSRDLMIQEYMKGQEIGADVYIDMINGEVVSIFTKKKLVMRAGETDKAVSFKDQKLFDLIERFVKESGFRGQIDIDIFENDGEYYISEVNPRFGGGYPHAFECGCNHMELIKNNLMGITNEKHIGAYDEDIYMMKYNEIAIRSLV
jgi:carbamoyl-phosphate synthase large subunit